jgi:hypothetical protein
MRALQRESTSREAKRLAPAGGAARWILLMPNLPTTPSYVRVKVWRRLQAIGAVALKNSVYVLPNRDECVEAFQWVAREIGELGGQASLCESRFFDGATDGEIEAKFVEERNADYAALAADARGVAKALRGKRLTAERLASLDSQIDKLKRRLDEIVAIDFAHASGGEAAAGLVLELASGAESRHGGEAPGETLARVPRPEKATWVTRTGVHVDRIASAWLIRRFIDPGATFKFVAAKGYAPEPGEVRFDMYEAEFTHVGDRCSFEVLLERIGLDDPALRAVGEIVHDIDLRDDKYGRPETAGVRGAIAGICASYHDDPERISRGSTLFDSLHAFFSLKKREKER